MLEIGTLKHWNSTTYKAAVQLMGSLTTYLDDIPVSVSIPSSAMVVGNFVLVAIPGGNIRDACVMASWPGGSPGGGGGGGMEVHGNEYHDPHFEEEGVAASLLATHAAAATGIHGVGAGSVAKVADIAVDANLSAAARDAISKKHGQNTDTRIQDADGDTQIQTEESADEDKIHMDVKGVEALLLDGAGVLTLAKQSGCRAYLDADQTINASAATKVNINHVTYDIQNEFNTSTHKFTAKTAGLYLIIHQLSLHRQTGSMADGSAICAYIKVNGAYIAETDLVLGGAFNPTLQCIAIIQLAVNDYVEAYAYHTDAGATVRAWANYDVLFLSKIA
jgi:hypothetical protein